MKSIATTLAHTLVLTASATPALAAGEGITGDMGWAGILFLGFGALILVFQLVPAVVLFSSMLRALFSARPRLTVTAEQKKP